MEKSNLIKVHARWDNVLVPANTATERSLLIEVGAESFNDRKTTREPVNFAMVIDCSGSMRGWRLEAAKSAAVGIAEALNGNDRLSLVSFDDEVTRHFANVPMYHDGIRQARQEVECLAAGNMTNLSAGWFEGAHVVTAWDVLRGEDTVGKNVVVADWRCDWIGLGNGRRELADFPEMCWTANNCASSSYIFRALKLDSF